MFNFHNRHYIFRQSDGQIRRFSCDLRQNLSTSTLGRNGIWGDVTVIARNVHQYFYAELGQDDFYHILYQDNSGNINYAKTDGQYVKAFPVLNSKTPAVYNKQLYIAPLSDEIYLFYVLQHGNSFLLAYQVLRNNRPGTPKIVDYVSGSSIPCFVLYDTDQNIYAFYQSYDGKYLQLGYKKFSTARKHWSDFTAVTKHQGNCEFPHVIIDSSGTIHLCYQRRTSKLYEIVCQHKTPDRNLWSAETVLHSSIHPFENASILQVKDRIIVYWGRDNIIYYCAGPLSGSSWSKPARYGVQPGRRLQCICYKEQQTRDGSSFSPGKRTGDGSSLSPGIYPGVVSEGFKLIFMETEDFAIDHPFRQYPSPAPRDGGTSVDELKSLVLSSFRQLQDKIGQMDAEWAEIRKEMPKLANAYMELSKETEKLSLRLNLLENKLAQVSNPYHGAEPAKYGLLEDIPGGHYRDTASSAPLRDKVPASVKDKPSVSAKDTAPSPEEQQSAAENSSASGDTIAANNDGFPESSGSQTRKTSAEGTKPSLDPEALKAWEEWQGPKEWIEGI